MALSDLNQQITACTQCPRLRKYCERIARTKRRAYLSDTYWGKPITGFGDPAARLMIVGLAPAAHGANRTGRIFTGDRSGDWLYRALHRTGFANQPTSVHANDGLRLQNAYVTCSVKCAPPDNKPSRQEQHRCYSHFEKEIALFPQVQVWIALGQLAFHTIWPTLKQRFQRSGSKPKFSHGATIHLDSRHLLILSYHPSQQNTFTGRLTEKMFDDVFALAASRLN